MRKVYCPQNTYREITKALGMNRYYGVASRIRRLKIRCHENKHIRGALEERIRQELALKHT